MPSYIVEIPGQGKFKVESPTDLTDEQAYHAAITMTPPKTSIGGYAKEALKGIPRGLVGGLEQAALGAAALLSAETEEVAREKIKKTAEAFKPAIAPGYEEAIPTKLGEAIGSFGSLLIPGGIGGAAARGVGLAARAGQLGAAGATATAMGAGEARERAIQEGATPEQIRTATILGTPVGLAELAPIERVFRLMPVEIKAGVFNYVKRALATGGLEGAQEAASQVAQNLIAKEVYKPSQQLVESVGESAAYGAGAGAIAQFVLDAVAGRRAPSVRPPTPTPSEATPQAAQVAPEAPAAEPIRAKYKNFKEFMGSSPSVEDMQAWADEVESRLATGEEGPKTKALEKQLETLQKAIAERPAEEAVAAPEVAAPEVAPSEEALPRLRGRQKQGELFTKAEAPVPEAARKEAEEARKKEEDARKQAEGEADKEAVAPQQMTLPFPLDKAAIDSFGIKGFGSKKLKESLIGVDVMTPEGRAKLEETLGKAQVLDTKAEEILNALPPLPERAEPVTAGKPELGVAGEGAKQPVSQPVSAGVGVAPVRGAGVESAVGPAGKPAAGEVAKPGALTKKAKLAKRGIEGDVKASLAALETAKPKEFNAHLDYLMSGPADVQARVPSWVTEEQKQRSRDRIAKLTAQDTSAAIRQLKAKKQRLESEFQDAVADKDTEEQASIALKIKSIDGDIRTYEKAARGSLGEPAAPTGNIKADVTAQLKKAFNAGREFDRVAKVVQSESELPEEIRKAGAKGITHKGRVWIVADNIAQGNELGVFLHEAGAHLGFDRILGKEGRVEVARIVRSWAKGNDLKARAAQEAIRKGGRSDDEVIAYTVEELVNNGVKPTAFNAESNWLKRVLNAFRSALKRIGFAQDITPQDLVDAAYGAAHIEIRGAEKTQSDYATGVALEKDLFGKTLTEKGEAAYAPMRKRYNALREEFGLEPVTSWDKLPDERLADARLGRTLEGRVEPGVRYSTAFTNDPLLDDAILRRSEALTRSADKPLYQQLIDSFSSSKGRATLADKFNVYVVDNAATVKRKLLDAGMEAPVINLAFASKSADVAVSSMLTGAIKLDPNTGAFRAMEGPSIRTVHEEVQKIAAKLNGANPKENFVAASRIFDLGGIVLRERSLPEDMRGRFKFDPEDIRAGEEALRKYGDEIKAGMKAWTDYKNGLLDAGLKAGRFSAEDVEEWKNAADYVPWHRILDDARHGYDVKSSAKQFFRGLQDSGKIKELVGGDVERRPIGDLLNNMEQLSFWMASATIKNHAANSVIDSLLTLDARKVGSPSAPDVDKSRVVRTFRDGQQTFYELGDTLDAYAFLGVQESTGPWVKFFAKGANMLRKGTTLMPGFVVGQLFQDGYRAAAYSGASRPFMIGAKTFSEFANELKGDELSKLFASYGIIGRPDYIFEDEKSRIRAELDETKVGIRRAASTGFKALDHLTRASDAAARRAVYKETLAEGGGEKAALYKAIEIINFQTRGANQAIATLRQVVPFTNAYIQGMSVALRSMAGRGITLKERSDAMRAFYATAAKIAALSSLYAMLVGDDDEYKNAPGYMKMSSFIIPGTREMIKEFTGTDPGGNIRIPVPNDPAGLLFKMIPEATIEYVSRLGTKDEMDATKFRKQLGDAALNSISPPGAVPQLVKPAIELWANKSFFTGNPIVGKGLEHLAKEQQFTAATSELAKTLTYYLPLSPVQIDHLARGMLGTGGATAMFVMSSLIDTFTPGERPSVRLNEIPQIRSFLTGSASSGMKEDYYNMRDKATEVSATVKRLMDRSPQEVQAYLEEHKELYAMAKSGVFYKIDTALGQVRKYREQIAADTKMSAEEKRAVLDTLEKQEVVLLASANIGMMRRMSGL